MSTATDGCMLTRSPTRGNTAEKAEMQLVAQMLASPEVGRFLRKDKDSPGWASVSPLHCATWAPLLLGEASQEKTDDPSPVRSVLRSRSPAEPDC